MANEYLRTRMAAAITEVTDISLHSADPGDTGANELTGGDPAYARVAVATWAPHATNAGQYVATLAGSFNLPPDAQVTHAGLWNGTQFVTKGACYASTTVQDTLTIQALTFIVPEPAAT